jgi:hypothetical protein
MDKPPKMAAIAQDSFEFIDHPFRIVAFSPQSALPASGVDF